MPTRDSKIFAVKTFILDASVVFRFLLADDPAQSPKAKELLVLAESGVSVCALLMLYCLTHVAVAELVWVLGSFLDFPRHDVGPKLRGLILHKGVEIDDQDMILGALDRFARIDADFQDCYTAAIADHSASPVAIYDRDFRKFTDVTCLKPEEILKAP
jgi:predicted nucleic-acid-binding protein